jgi:hypothetical protein
LLTRILQDWIRRPPKTGGKKKTVKKKGKQRENANLLSVKYGKEVKRGKIIENC